MPVYNGAKYLNESIDSILNQTFSDFEFLIIDDGSTDDSVDIIKSFNDKRINLTVNDINQGQTICENNGIDNSRGKYIARIDQDDIMIQDRLKKQVNYLEENSEIAVLGSQYSCIDHNGNHLDEMLWPIGIGNNIYSCITGFSPVGHPGALIRKNVFEQVGKYDPQYAPAEDYELWLRLLANGYRTDNLKESLTKYRKHQSQTSTLQGKLLRKNHILAFKIFYHLMVGMQLTTNDLIEYFNIFKFKAKVKQNNISKIFTIYFSLLTSINKIYYLDRDIKSVLHQQFFNAIGKNVDDVSFFNIISEAINHRVLGLDVKRQLWAIYKARLQSSEM
jgi:glycosyltransferase involved in cell wall biosynthesis